MAELIRKQIGMRGVQVGHYCLVEYCWGYHNSLKNVRTTKIIIHTMSVDNNINLRDTRPLLASETPPLPPLLVPVLSRQADYYRCQLSQALAINSSLIQHAKQLNEALSNNTTQYESYCPNVASAPSLPQVKIEHTDMTPPSVSESEKSAGRKGERKVRTAEDEEEHDKNETKNIPKNYGKAMLSFIQKNIRKYSDLVKPILSASNQNVVDLLLSVRRHKKEVNSINYLKLIWGHGQQADPIFKCIRIMSNIFMRKHCLEYIFNSRIKNYSTHIKYKKRIMEGIANTEDFTCIKQF